MTGVSMYTKIPSGIDNDNNKYEYMCCQPIVSFIETDTKQTVQQTLKTCICAAYTKQFT